ncbi:unnamed protein product [Cuscuta epithymum]|uniref:Uncharacterized protein n=1 Tax=Cuscuta epithymum TaxID=186058 RepID=A0AAV0EVQ5_9ASTE|nr:unnamed protein product [Cuscuta epithymum]
MSTESTEQILHMNGGTGDHSYAHNATAPLKVTMRAKPIMEESIKKMFQRIATSPSCLRIADLGCSSGANALKAASNIMDMISMVAEEEAMIMSSDEKLPATFQVFLNDLFGNDFNALFKVVPELHKEIRTKSDGLCFFNATPGSFFGRLFPSHSIHFFHSSFAVHWLTQAPKEMRGEIELPVDKEGSNVYLTSINPPSYKAQFKEDLKLFLRSRHEEIVPGGTMFLTLIGSYDTSDFQCRP